MIESTQSWAVCTGNAGLADMTASLPGVGVYVLLCGGDGLLAFPRQRVPGMVTGDAVLFSWIASGTEGRV